MKISRRNFLFGSAATLGVIAIAEIAPYIEPITLQSAGYKKRYVSKIGVNGLAIGEEPISVSLKRWPLNTTLFHVSVHPRSVYIWLPVPGGEPLFTDKSLMLIEATGCPSRVTIEGHDDGVWFLERYSFPDQSKERWLLS